MVSKKPTKYDLAAFAMNVKILLKRPGKAIYQTKYPTLKPVLPKYVKLPRKSSSIYQILFPTKFTCGE